MHLLLLPGLACDETLFAHQRTALDRFIVASKRPWRCSVSHVHTQQATLPAMARALLDQHDGPLLPIGASMGGMLALELQRQAPRRVHAMALLGSSARADTPELIALRTEACALFEQGRIDEVLAANLPLAFHPDSCGDSALLQAYRAMVRRAGAAQLVAQNRAVMARVDSRPGLPAIRCPLLLACGEADRLTPPALLHEIAAAVPHARLEVVAGAGHMLTMEQPARVSALLTDWLAGL